MRKPNPNEVLFMHPITDEFWYLPLIPRGNSDTDAVRKITMSGIGTFPPKEVQNDWTRANHEVLSSYTQSDTTGGGQIYEVDEATDGSRFWFATADTQRIRQVVLPRKATAVDGLTGPIIGLGDYDDEFIFSADGTLYSIDSTGVATSLAVTLAADPKEREGIAFKGTHTDLDFYIAVEGGYQVWDGTTLSALITTAKPVDWAEWDNKLYAIQADGQLGENPDGQSANWTFPVKVDARYTPTHLVEFYDRQDEPCLHIVTRSAVFAVDRANTKALKTMLRPPRSPYAGDAACTFRTDLFVGYGLSVDQYTGQSIIPMGLDRDYGMPYAFRGHIHCMTDGYNGIYAIVHGGTIADDGWPETMSSLSRHHTATPGTGSPAAIMVWNVNGWHTIWQSGQDLNEPTNLVFSNADDTFRLYWSIGDLLYYMDFPTALFNPIQRDIDWEFEESGYIEYGAFDFSTVGMLKIMVGIEVRSKDVTEDETLEVEYSLDDGPYQSLGMVTTQPSLGMTRLLLGLNGTFPDGTVRYDGISADSIRPKVTFARGSDATKTPILESIGIVFQKLMGTLNGYEFDVDCSTGNGYNSRTNAEIQQFLHELINIGRLVPWYHQDEWKSVRLAGVSGEDETGTDIKGNRHVALLEVVEDA
jgi:hypothetical protein